MSNISFSATEEDLRNLFAQVGQVVSLRLVSDRETGKRKGFGFVEYSDQEAALSAVRNLNELEFHGRALRVNAAEQDTKNPGLGGAGTGGDAAGSRKRKGGAGADGAAMPMPGNGSAPPMLPPLDPVSAYVERLGREHMFELALQAKNFTATQPTEAAHLFTSSPQLFSALHLVIDRLAGPHFPHVPSGDDATME